MRKPKECTRCARAVNDSFICRRCGKELRDLLIGTGWPETVGELASGQPGIVWYMRRLHEAAYKQTKMERSSVRGSQHGYYLLGDNRAIRLVARISATLTRWDAELDVLVGIQTMEQVSRASLSASGFHDLDAYRARRLAAHIPQLRHNCPEIASLYVDMLEYAKKSWKIINRPNDICCGACPNPVLDEDRGEQPCGVLLYAEESEETVQCPECRAQHNVGALRNNLKNQARDKLFTGPELLRLMKTTLNDQMSKSTFYQLVRDGRLQYRGFDAEGDPVYTYGDVCEAREKERPRRRYGARAR